MKLEETRCPTCYLMGTLSIEERLVSAAFGTWSLAGNQVKAPARTYPFLECSACSFSLRGEYDGPRHAVFAPPRTGS